MKRVFAVFLSGFAIVLAVARPVAPIADGGFRFALHQPDVFREGGALTNAVADFDNDGDPDIFVGFNNKPNRLYRNDRGIFKDVSGDVGLAEAGPIRTSAWGDFDRDGHLDLFLAYVDRDKSWDRLYRNEGNGKRFADVTISAGAQLTGNFRQAAWVDFDNDGDVDLFAAFRDKPNVLLRNEHGKFRDEAGNLGIDDPRRSVGAVWFDYDKDGDLDLYVTNQDGDANGMFRNDGDRFVDAAEELGVESGGRPMGSPSFGSVRPNLADYDNDGDFDIFCANYGPNGLLRNEDGKSFVNAAPGLGLGLDACFDSGVWGDWDNNGRIDLYVNGTVTRGKSFEDYLFRNEGIRFSDVTPDIIKKNNADHGAQGLDFDKDGDLDLALTGGMHQLLRNELPSEKAKQSLQVIVLDEKGRYTKAGSEIRIYDRKTNALRGTQLLDTGSGYNSQNAAPVHFGLPGPGEVDVEVTTMTASGRKSARLEKIDPKDYLGKYLVIRVDPAGQIIL